MRHRLARVLSAFAMLVVAPMSAFAYDATLPEPAILDGGARVHLPDGTELAASAFSALVRYQRDPDTHRWQTCTIIGEQVRVGAFDRRSGRVALAVSGACGRHFYGALLFVLDGSTQSLVRFRALPGRLRADETDAFHAIDRVTFDATGRMTVRDINDTVAGLIDERTCRFGAGLTQLDCRVVRHRTASFFDEG